MPRGNYGGRIGEIFSLEGKVQIEIQLYKYR